MSSVTNGQLTLPLFAPGGAPEPAPPADGTDAAPASAPADTRPAAAMEPPSPAAPEEGRRPDPAPEAARAAPEAFAGALDPADSTPNHWPGAPPLLRSQTLPLRSAAESPSAAAEVIPPAASLEQLAAIARACSRCRLRTGCRQVVFGEGNPRARLMFVGEGPGEQEDIQGRPFVGRAGQLLDRMIEAMGLRRQDVYIANVVKCRPPGNRTPQPDEADACWPFLRRQIELVNPRIIVCLGATAANRLLGPGHGVTKSRGRLYDWHGRLLAVTFHPAALLRFPAQKKLAWEDLKLVMQAYDEAAEPGA